MNLGTCKLFARLKVPIDCYPKRISIAFQGLSESFDVLCRDCCIRENLRRCRSMCESHKASQDCKVGQGSQPPLPVGESQGCAQCQRRNYLASPKTFEEHPTPRQSQQNHQTTLVCLICVRTSSGNAIIILCMWVSISSKFLSHEE